MALLEVVARAQYGSKWRISEVKEAVRWVWTKMFEATTTLND